MTFFLQYSTPIYNLNYQWRKNPAQTPTMISLHQNLPKNNNRIKTNLSNPPNNKNSLFTFFSKLNELPLNKTS